LVVLLPPQELSPNAFEGVIAVFVCAGVV
jgi:hypothetical protein